MVQCRFFLQGCCRYGASCRFEHSYSQKYTYHAPQSSNQNSSSDYSSNNIAVEQLVKLIVTEVTAAIDGKQWLLSCYGPFKNKLNFPGLTDISPEELRHSAYESQNNGTLQDNLKHLKVYQENVLKNNYALLKPSGAIMNTIQSLYKGEQTNDPFETTTNGNFMSTNIPFNNSTQADNLFGAYQSPNIFTANQSQHQNIDNIFTTSSKAYANNLFAAAAQAGSVTNDMFEDPFLQNDRGASAFQNSSNSNVFNTNTSNIIDKTNIQSIGFGNPLAAATPSALFASANAELKTSIQVQGNPFIKSAVSDQNTFGNNPFNSFGITQPQFGSKVPAHNEEVYSKTENLSPEEIKCFEEKIFKHGYIPEVAPPFYLCTQENIF